MPELNIHPDIRKFWENQGHQIKTSDEVYFNVDGGESTNELFYAWTDDTHYFIIADIGANKSYYFFEWSKYSEAEMLEIIKPKVAS